MRALGPGSVSSLLKIALDVAYWGLLLIIGIIAAGFIGSFFIPLTDLNVTLNGVEGPVETALTRGLIAFGLTFAALYVGAFAVILHRLRLVFRALAAGEPFVQDNVRRLRQIGFVLAGAVALQVCFSPLLTLILPSADVPVDIGDLIVPIFSVLVIFVLSEVFREGARLRHEQELTI